MLSINAAYRICPAIPSVWRNYSLRLMRVALCDVGAHIR